MTSVSLTSNTFRRVCALAGAATIIGLTGAVAPAAAASVDPTVERAFLRGAREVPGPGDADGVGQARLTIRERSICYTLSWHRIGAPTAAHIHAGASTESGPVVVTLFENPAGIQPPVRAKSGCVRVAPALATQIRTSPFRYYVNIHNTEFPAGALRGQLFRP